MIVNRLEIIPPDNLCWCCGQEPRAEVETTHGRYLGIYCKRCSNLPRVSPELQAGVVVAVAS